MKNLALLALLGLAAVHTAAGSQDEGTTCGEWKTCSDDEECLNPFGRFVCVGRSCEENTDDCPGEGICIKGISRCVRRTFHCNEHTDCENNKNMKKCNPYTNLCWLGECDADCIREGKEAAQTVADEQKRADTNAKNKYKDKFKKCTTGSGWAACLDKAKEEGAAQIFNCTGTICTAAENGTAAALMQEQVLKTENDDIATVLIDNKDESADVRKEKALVEFKKQPRAKNENGGALSDTEIKIEFAKVQDEIAIDILTKTRDECLDLGTAFAQCENEANDAYYSAKGKDGGSAEDKTELVHDKMRAAANKAVTDQVSCTAAAIGDPLQLSECNTKGKTTYFAGFNKTYADLPPTEKAVADVEYSENLAAVASKKLNEAMRVNKGKDKAVQDAAARAIWEATQTTIYDDDESKEIAFEKAKIAGAKVTLAETFAACQTEEGSDCDGDAQTAYADSMGLTKGDDVGFTSGYKAFKTSAAATLAVEKNKDCKKVAGNTADACAELAKEDAAKNLGEAKKYTDMDSGEKAKFDAKLAGITAVARAKKVAEAYSANKNLPEANRTAAALAIYTAYSPNVYATDAAGIADAQMDFEQAKRTGAQAGLAETMIACKETAGTDCQAKAQAVFVESMGISEDDRGLEVQTAFEQAITINNSHGRGPVDT